MEIYNDLLPDPLPTEPMALASAWLATALAARQQPNPDAMVLATASADGIPSARVVLAKEFDVVNGRVSFVTNYDSRKGRELANNPRAALVLHWDHAHRQVRIEGIVVKAPAAESDAYFESRNWQRRLGAWASAQSQPLTSRGQLNGAVDAAADRFGAPRPTGENINDHPPVVIPRPSFWGGYYVWADAVELWVEGAARIHERARWTRTLTTGGDGFAPGPWSATRLQP
ncbi:MAG TPA: pyridoxamine 5'-phosphate oxidase [Steroidobacteraceae bacterium]|nr:pyridoxamine 5'-phosphate oxidase [Steroidobacteraceae bacterium]